MKYFGNLRDYLADVFSFFIDVAVAAVIWRLLLPEWNVYLIALGLPIGVRLILIVWKCYTYSKKFVWIAYFEQKRQAKIVAEQFRKLDLPAPPMFLFGDVTKYFDSIANDAAAKPEHIYAAGFLTGSINGLLPVSWIRYRLALVNYKSGMERYRKEFVGQADGRMIRRDKL